MLESACEDPTQPLCLGTDVETGKPVTLARTECFAPILITGQMATGKTTLSHHLARQQLTPASSLGYVTSHAHSLTELSQGVPEHREGITITPGSDGETGLTTDFPADIGTAGALSRIQLERDSDSNTAVLRTLIEEVLANRHRQRGSEISPYTLVLDGIDGCVEMDQLALSRLFAEARKLRLRVVLTALTLTSFPRTVQRQLATHVQTYITGQVDRTDAQHLAPQYSTPTAADLMAPPRYQWWLRHPPSARSDTQFVSSLPSSGPQDTA